MIQAIFSIFKSNKSNLSEKEARQYLIDNARINIETHTDKYNRTRQELLEAYNNDELFKVNHLEGFIPYYQNTINYEKSVLTTVKHRFKSIFSLRKFQYKEIDRLHELNPIDFELEKAKRAYEERNFFNDADWRAIWTTDLI